MNELITLIIALFFAFIGGELAKKFHYPRIIGQLGISLLFGFSFFEKHLSAGASGEIITVLSQLGAILLLFLTGFDIDIKAMKMVKKKAIWIALFAAIIPLTMGIALGHLLGFGWIAALVLGAAMSVTAEGTKVALLIEMKKVNSRMGVIMLGAGIVDDIFEILFLALVLIYANQSGWSEFYFFPLKVAAFALVIAAGYYLLPKILQHIERGKDTISLLNLMLLIALVFAAAAEIAGLSAILGAFIGGILAQKSFLSKMDIDQEDHLLHAIAFSLLIPFFFIHVGLNFSVASLFENPGLTLMVLAVAILGKLGGTLLTKPLVDLSWKKLALIGWGMNSRGIMELVIAQIAFTSKLINKDLYSAIVFMSITTTLLFPLVIQRMIKKDPQIMD